MSFIGVMSPDVEIEFENKKYKFSALNFKTIAEYVIWYQYRELEIQKQVTKDLPVELRDKILVETHKKCQEYRWIIKDTETGEITGEYPLAWDCPEVQQSIRTPEGIAQQAYLSLKNNHPDMTYDLANRICQIKTIDEVLNKITLASGLTPDEIPGETHPNQ